MSLWATIGVLLFGCAVVIWVYVPRRRRRRQRPEYLKDPLGVVTLGGEYAVLLPRGIDLPVEGHEVFATAGEDDSEITVELGWGEASSLDAARSRARIRVYGIRPGPPGVPRIEVVFRVDEDARLRVSARDLMHRKVLQVDPGTLPTPSGED